MIIPSIDLQDGRAVQLRQGRELLLVDPRDPVALAAEFGRYGPVAVVDLDAALGRGNNRDLIRRLCRVAECRVGGGIREEEDVRSWIRAGAAKVMVGTRAEPEFLGRFPPEWIVACLDARGDDVVVRGWTTRAGATVLERARALRGSCSEFLFTQVSVEGTLQGCDLDRAARLRRETEVPVTVAGGIRSVSEVVELEKLGCNSQLGRALYEGRIDLTSAWIAGLAFDDRGLVPTVVQDDEDGTVLMVAYSNRESLARALESGQGWYFSRSRGRLWRKGESSGNEQRLVRAAWDCDRDTVVFRVRPSGPACHTGRRSCFGIDRRSPLRELERTLAERQAAPAGSSYTRRLLDDPDLLAGKLREETGEVIEAAERGHIAWECADLLYHLMVRMRAAGLTLSEVGDELRSRFRRE
jgi:phosphoribosyl-ATP pyrophosphohydrolase